ncbi:ectoine/hydroxyectoine ABC transporter permease subunit EhuD, partial [Burkholderia multivorans]|uniref:ABC transporter permease subunit n=1 Tax=Burkholderia multivorans TaxID=87883 RepID=UPI000DB2F837
MWNWEFAPEALPILLRGFVNTLIATVVGTIIAAILGLILAIAIRGLPRWINWGVRLFVAFVRNTPLVVQLVFVYTAFSEIPGHVDIPALVVGSGVIGVHYATYMSESYRAGIDAVPPGQREA